MTTNLDVSPRGHPSKHFLQDFLSISFGKSDCEDSWTGLNRQVNLTYFFFNPYNSRTARKTEL